jgi:hypothetical protein
MPTATQIRAAQIIRGLEPTFGGFSLPTNFKYERSSSKLCRECNTTHRPSACKVCHHCRRVCGCKGIPHFWRELQTPTQLANTLSINSCKINKIHRALSLEVEMIYYGELLHRKFNNFVFTTAHDGSVNISRQEMVIGGLIGDNIIASILELATAAYEEEARVDSSCGYHVHVDTRDFSYWQYDILLRLWLKLEDWIYTNLFPPIRKSTKYAIPLKQHPRVGDYLKWAPTITNTHELKTLFLYMITGMRVPEQCTKGNQEQLDEVQKYINFKASKPQNRQAEPLHFRYFGLNLHSALYRGSVEFRPHHGTTDVIELVYWPIFCLDIVAAAARLGQSQVQNICDPYAWVQKNCSEVSKQGIQEILSRKYSEIK